MGELYLARSSGTGGWEKRVAIKTVLPHLSNQLDSIARFADEARIATTLTHGNIVQVFDFDKAEDGTYFIAMEYVDGWDLRWLLKAAEQDERRISEPIAIFVAAEMCRGLEYAHSRTDDNGDRLNIVHRDITPSNVLISRDGEVKLTDFGIAAAKNRFERTVTGELRGKFGYMSPEQASGEPVDHRSDIFSVGIVLFQMLTGAKPFDGESDMDTLARVQAGERPRLRELIEDVDPELEQIVERALAFEPEDRFQSAEAMQVALLGLLYRDTQPVTDRQLADFCKSLHTERMDPAKDGASSSSGPGFDTLLRQQLNGDGSASEANGAAKAREASGTNGSNSRPLPAKGPTDSGNRTQTVDAASHKRRSKQRRRWQLFGLVAVVAIAIGALVLSYRAGQQGSILPTVLRVETKPPGARVFVDGTPYGLTTLIERVKPGVHVLQIYNDGYEPVQRTVTAAANQLTRVALHLTPEDDARDVQTFTTVQFFVEPGDGTITVGDSSVRDGETLVVPVGEEQGITFEAEGYEPLNFNHTFVRGEDRLIRRLDPKEGQGAEDEQREAEQAAAAAQARQERHQNAMRTMDVRLVGVPSGSAVSIDGERVDDTEQLTLPRRGSVSLRVDAPGYQTLSRTVSSEEWTDGDLALDLQELRRGWVTVRFVGDVLRGEILIDGRSLGENRSGPRARFELTEGMHELRVVNEQTGHTFERTVEIDEASDKVVAIDWKMPSE
jgi:serine/threonine protein kinase/mannose-6-phosphate isomerase-like protein (cupin superfamily)